jgi:tetratricopeptide (TPR) repeat protein
MIVPYISREDVSAALSSLIHTTRKPVADGLQHLLLVDLLVNAPDMPNSDEKRAFAAQELLIMEITRALHEQCDLFRLLPPGERTQGDEIQKEAAELIKVGKHNLMAWSIVYYRYVRADLGLSVEELAQLFMVTPRTVTRYHDDGIDMLVQRLIREEQLARRSQTERRLYAMLPYSVPITLVGRDDLLDTAESLLETLLPCHILITGGMGVGKTVFVQELLRRQIAAGRLNQLVWLDDPASTQFVHEQITEQLLREGSEITLRDYLLMYRVVVVLDGLELVMMDETVLSPLLRDLGAAVVILINRTYVALEGAEAHLPLPEIDPEAANKLINQALRLQANTDSEHIREVAYDLYHQLGGNPLALRLAAGMWESTKNWNALNLDIHERLFGHMFTAFSDQVKAAWCAFVLLVRPVRPDRLASLWGISARAVNLLLRHCLIEGDPDTGYSLVAAAREYIRQTYPTDENIQKHFAGLLAELNVDELVQDVFEQVLLTGFPEITLVERAEVIRRLWKAGLMRRHWAKWRIIIEEYMHQVDEVEPEIRIAYGICLRSLTEWEAAQQIFYDLSLECGRSGLFDEQACALIEWSVLAKYRGEYQRAQALIAQTRRYALRAHDDYLLHEATFREAWILVEQGKGAEANRLLATLPESLRGLVVQSEAQLVLGNHDACCMLAERALQLNKDDQATEASLYTIIGRSYQKQKAYQQAHVYLVDAMTLLQRLDDIFRLARAQTNLAAVLIAMRRYADAEMLLTDAAQVQSHIGDRVGLSATRHNLSVLDGHIAR